MRRLIVLLSLFLLGLPSPAGSAQEAAPDPANQQQPLLDAGQLDQLVAPIALYPDPLLAQVLMASTEYGNSGIMTFMVNHDGTVFEKDLGPRTAKLARKVESFAPDQTWAKVDSSQ